MINSDGYIMLDFKDVDFRQTNQHIEGLFDRLRSVIGTNKFVLVINANGKTPMPSAVSMTNGQYVIEAYIYTFSVNASDMLHITKHSDVDDIIDDDHASTSTTWSSKKIQDELADITIDNLSDIGDVVIDTPTEGQILVYDNTSDKWTNKTPAPGGLSTNTLYEYTDSYKNDFNQQLTLNDSMLNYKMIYVQGWQGSKDTGFDVAFIVPIFGYTPTDGYYVLYRNQASSSTRYMGIKVVNGKFYIDRCSDNTFCIQSIIGIN